MATDQLAIYNIAIASVGERTLTALSEERPIRRQLDAMWNAGPGARNFFLQQGLWNFAMRESSSTASSTGNFHFSYRHALPTDFVRLSAISEDQSFGTPLLGYEIQSSSIWSNSQTLYLRYVSASSTAGLNYDLWPYTFTLWAGHWLGTRIAPYVLGVDFEEKAGRNISDREGLTKKLAGLEYRANKLLVDARSKDAQDETTRFMPTGSWVNARRGRSGSDGGSRSNLIG